MNRYELTYIIDTKLEEAARKELIEKFSGLIRQNGGEVEKVDETWGKRRLAYPINDMLEGYYVLVTFQGEGDLPREIERNLEISESVLRYLIIKLVEKKHSVKPRPVRVQTPAAAPVEAAEAVQAPAVEAVEAAQTTEAAPTTEAVETVESEAVVTGETPVDSAE
jgi:small subunit ribosomal protein S6